MEIETWSLKLTKHVIEKDNDTQSAAMVFIIKVENKFLLALGI